MIRRCLEAGELEGKFGRVVKAGGLRSSVRQYARVRSPQLAVFFLFSAAFNDHLLPTESLANFLLSLLPFFILISAGSQLGVCLDC